MMSRERSRACRTLGQFVNRACPLPTCVAPTCWEPVRDYLRFRCLKLEVNKGHRTGRWEQFEC